MKVVSKVTVQDAIAETTARGLACEPHTMCPRCRAGRG